MLLICFLLNRSDHDVIAIEINVFLFFFDTEVDNSKNRTKIILDNFLSSTFPNEN